LLAALVWGLFGQTARFGFVNYDDMAVYQTPAITGGLTWGGIRWAFTHPLVGEWIPLTTLTHMLDCQLFGLRAGGHHLSNVLFHCVTVILLFLALRRMTGSLWRSAFVAAFFAIHPLRVESVAWVTERKDVLSGIFFMLTLRAHARGRRGMALVWFALGLMCKPMLVTTPFVLLLLDYWPLGRIRTAAQFPALLKEKIPLFVISGVACVAEIFAAKGAIQPIENFSFPLRACNGVVAYVIYLRMLLHPGSLAVFYPLFDQGPPAWQVIGAGLLLVGLTAGAWYLRRSQPYLLVGWLWYLGMLLPVIGLLQTGEQAYADRFTYLPQIGLCLAGTWSAANWAGGRLERRRLLAGAAAASLLLLYVAASRQASYWRDSVTLWTHSLSCTPDNAIARFTLGDALGQQGRPEEAMAQYREALRLNPGYVNAHNNLGLTLVQLGQTDDAIAEYREALRLDPNRSNAHINLGDALAQEGRLQEAIDEFREAIRVDPASAEAHYDLGKALAPQGRIDDAIAEYREAVRIDPDYADAQNNLGIALAGKGQVGEAISHLEYALALDPSSLSHLNNLAWVLATAQDPALRNGPRAVELALKANAETGGGNLNILHTLAAAYAEAGDSADAVKTAQQALQIAEAQSNPALSGELRRELALYQAGRRFENTR
jgi:tetratricopeptide (TPR) repeat protein